MHTILVTLKKEWVELPLSIMYSEKFSGKKGDLGKFSSFDEPLSLKLNELCQLLRNRGLGGKYNYLSQYSPSRLLSLLSPNMTE